MHIKFPEQPKTPTTTIWDNVGESLQKATTVEELKDVIQFLIKQVRYDRNSNRN